MTRLGLLQAGHPVVLLAVAQAQAHYQQVLRKLVRSLPPWLLADSAASAALPAARCCSYRIARCAACPCVSARLCSLCHAG